MALGAGVTPAADARRVGGVVFDLDGTLIDSCEDITRSANACLIAAGFRPRAPAEMQTFIGDGARLLLARASELDPKDARLDPLLERFFDHYTAHALDHTRLLPGARDVLAALAPLPLGLCTNKPRVTTLAVLEGLGLASTFSAVVAAGDVPHNKPHAAPLERAAALLGVPCADLVMVGDGPQDIACARNAGARSVGISEAIIVPLERLAAAGPDAIVALRDVPELIARWGAAALSGRDR